MSEIHSPGKGHRVFFGVFLAIQAVFLVWVVAGAVSGETIGTTIGVGVIVAIWLATDFLVAVTYAMYWLAGRPPRRTRAQH
ncbi:hypothetical protein [Streptomyces sp. BA2]|uniref:hypothetical protein n=1 Tax=Streptomyces sp. BA2 TaxID=436595 RepID=UPI0013224D01|nr:hypothetical protein [Streptomyces sp. BA2]MWA12448.1 hypothetical protein [Streptomyces sp. BA2]